MAKLSPPIGIRSGRGRNSSQEVIRIPKRNGKEKSSTKSKDLSGKCSIKDGFPGRTAGFGVIIKK